MKINLKIELLGFYGVSFLFAIRLLIIANAKVAQESMEPLFYGSCIGRTEVHTNGAEGVWGNSFFPGSRGPYLCLAYSPGIEGRSHRCWSTRLIVCHLVKVQRFEYRAPFTLIIEGSCRLARYHICPSVTLCDLTSCSFKVMVGGPPLCISGFKGHGAHPFQNTCIMHVTKTKSSPHSLCW